MFRFLGADLAGYVSLVVPQQKNAVLRHFVVHSLLSATLMSINSSIQSDMEVIFPRAEQVTFAKRGGSSILNYFSKEEC